MAGTDPPEAVAEVELVEEQAVRRPATSTRASPAAVAGTAPERWSACARRFMIPPGTSIVAVPIGRYVVRRSTVDSRQSTVATYPASLAGARGVRPVRPVRPTTTSGRDARPGPYSSG